MSNNPNGNDNYWPANQHVPHHYAHAQHQQLHHPAPQPVPQMLAQHMQQHPHPYAPVVPASVAGFYQNVPGRVDTFTNNPNVYPHPHGSPQLGDEYTDAYGQLIKVVYNTPHQATTTGLMVRPQDDANQNHPGSSKPGYELFSNNSSFMLAAPGFGFTLHNPPQQQQQMHQHQDQQQQQQSEQNLEQQQQQQQHQQQQHQQLQHEHHQNDQHHHHHQQQQQHSHQHPQQAHQHQHHQSQQQHHLHQQQQLLEQEQQQQQQKQQQQLQLQPQLQPQAPSIEQQHEKSTHQPHAQSSVAELLPSAVQSSSLHTAENGNNNTCELISQLVGNWAPTISGTYGNGPSLVNDGLETHNDIQNAKPQADGQKCTTLPNKEGIQKPAVNPVSPTIGGTISSLPTSLPSSPNVSVTRRTKGATTSVAAVYNQQNDDNSAKLDQNVNKKQRIIAEVKPMRMSYSDVLSKNVTSGGGGAGAGASVGTLTGSGNILPTGVNGDVVNNGPGVVGNGTKQASLNGANGIGTTSTKTGKRESKKVGTTNGSERKPAIGSTSNQKDRGTDGSSKRGDRVNVGAAGTGAAPSSASEVTARVEISIDVKQGQEKNRKNDKLPSKKEKGTSRISGTEGVDSISLGKVRRSRRSDDMDASGLQIGDDAALLNDETEEERGDEFDEDESEEFDQDSVESETGGQQNSRGNMNGSQQQQSAQFVYNVKKNTNGSNDTHIEKINPPRSSAYKKAAASGRGAGGSRNSSKQQAEKLPGITSGGGKRSGRSRKNQKYAFLEKLMLKWLEYMVIALHWLWSLVSDVVYLSARLAWDYVLSGYHYFWQHVRSVRCDFRKNVGRPGAWFRGTWQSFDNRFEKDSRWAFWRRCRRDKPTIESAGGKSNGSHYKDGRLPSTADEAMSSLLNCKGKDAYSILGVSPDCSQEQIRKHYKKIAVLVHPDKNKQPGAEEAFKVLQRSFELIGEPESRHEYDQSLAEALNAEKAWSEINDLLTQLHTKISEAANTIRCSSCCLRHPRKPTGRAHYAARECSSCKIRHPAREGDIWAETTFFGIRWKYLAMMEGNVYDITEWANCQKGALSHLQPNSHIVQYRIVLGSSSQQQHQQQQQQNQQQGQQQEKEHIGRSRKEPTPNEPNLDDFLNNIYAGQNQQAVSQSTSSRRRYRRN